MNINTVPRGLLDAAQELETAWGESAFDHARAVGIAIDDPSDPHVAVAVHDGRIVYIGISDPMLQVTLDELTDSLNAAILNAFAMWRAQRSGTSM
jgi:hypothetical protein